MRKKGLKLLVLALGMVFLLGGKSFAEEIEVRGVVVDFDITMLDSTSTSYVVVQEKDNDDLWDKMCKYFRSYSATQERDNEGNTPLHSACKNNYTEIVKILLNADVCVNEQNNDGFTALHYACENGNVEMVKTLLEAGASVKIRNNNGDDPLNYVCSRWERDILSLFEQTGYYNIQTKITCKHNEKEIIELLVANGANINSRNIDNSTVLDNFTTILFEKSYEFANNNEKSKLIASLVKEIEWLLQKGAKANDIRDLDGNNLLNYACKKGYENIVTLLISK